MKHVEYDGNFVLTRERSKDFGEISAEVAARIKREQGKIRLERGFQIQGRGFGEAHIERPERLRQLRNNGFENARDYIEYVARDYDAIYQGKGSNIILIKSGINSNIAFLSIKQDENDGKAYWTVESAFIARKDYLKNKTPLWIKNLQR